MKFYFYIFNYKIKIKKIYIIINIIFNKYILNMQTQCIIENNSQNIHDEIY